MEKVLGHQVILDVEVGSWRASLCVGETAYLYDEVDRILDRELAAGRQVVDASAVVEIRRWSSGINPRALLSGRFTADDSGWFTLSVANTGEFPDECFPSVEGLQGRPLCLGLPVEFAQASMDGLLRFDPETRPSGRLEVLGGCFDMVDSSESIFELAAGMLKWALLRSSQISDESLREFVGLRIARAK